MILFHISQTYKRPGNQIVYLHRETVFQCYTHLLCTLLKSEIPGVHTTKAKGGALGWNTFPDCDGTGVPDSS